MSMIEHEGVERFYLLGSMMGVLSGWYNKVCGVIRMMGDLERRRRVWWNFEGFI